MNFIVVGLGGFLGALFRYGFSLLFSSSDLPWSTLVVNFLGCVLVGIFASTKDHFSLSLYLFLVPGFLGAFTTFSAFGLETIKLFQNNQAPLAILNVILNLALGLLAVALISRWLLPVGGSL